MVSLKHLFQSAKVDGSDATVVKPSNWNEEHKFETSGDSVVLGRATGAGAGPVQELALGAMFPPGSIIAFGGETAPAGWLLCNGASVSRTTYAALFAVLSTNYGGSGSNFNVPNLQGRVPAGAGGTLLNASGFNKLTAGGVGGTQTHTLTTAQMPSHAHGHGLTASDPGHVHVFHKSTGAVTVPNTVNTVDSVLAVATAQSGTGAYSIAANMQEASTGITISGSIDTIGGGSAHPNVQPTLLVNYIIKT